MPKLQFIVLLAQLKMDQTKNIWRLDHEECTSVPEMRTKSSRSSPVPSASKGTPTCIVVLGDLCNAKKDKPSSAIRLNATSDQVHLRELLFLGSISSFAGEDMFAEYAKGTFCSETPWLWSETPARREVLFLPGPRRLSTPLGLLCSAAMPSILPGTHSARSLLEGSSVRGSAFSRSKKGCMFAVLVSSALGCLTELAGDLLRLSGGVVMSCRARPSRDSNIYWTKEVHYQKLTLLVASGKAMHM